MPYPDGNYSDGKIILDLLRGKEEIIRERTYCIKWHQEGNHWLVLDHNDELVNSFEDEEAAVEKAREITKINRPSKVMNSKGGEEKEVCNYPRIPL